MKPVRKSIYEFFCEAVQEEGGKRYLFDEEQTLTFAETLQAAVGRAETLHKAGVRQGSLLALRTTRTVSAAVLLYAAQFLGSLTALLDPHGPLSQALEGKSVQPDFLLTDEDGEWTLTGVKSGAVTALGPLTLSSEEPSFDTAIDVMKPSLIIFTSGSTGAGKGVLLSQYNVMNHIRNYSEAGCYYPDDVSMEVLPVEHVFGLAVILMGLYKRYEVLFPKSVKVDYVAGCIEKHRITRLDGVPSYALALAKETEGRGMESLRTAVMGGAPVSLEQFAHIERTLGLTIVPVYGMSECIGISGIPVSEPMEKRAGTVGRFLPMCEGRIAEDGEICVRGAPVTSGYYNDPDSTAAVIDGEGFLHTGDLGFLDEGGYLHVTGRKKDIIIRNGRNLSPTVIEKKLLSLPFIDSVAVVGMPDADAGEVPCAAVVLKKGLAWDAIAVSEALTKPEVPKRVAFLDALPLLPSGKPDKLSVRRSFS